MGDVVAQRLVRRTWDLKIESSSPDRCTHVVFFGKTLTCYSASLHQGVFYKWEPANCFRDNLTKFWEVTCDGLVSHPEGVKILLVA